MHMAHAYAVNGLEPGRDTTGVNLSRPEVAVRASEVKINGQHRTPSRACYGAAALPVCMPTAQPEPLLGFTSRAALKP